jgi:hypothetical protein
MFLTLIFYDYDSIRFIHLHTKENRVDYKGLA